MDPGSQELQPRRAGVPQNNILHDVGVSGATGAQGLAPARRPPRWRGHSSRSNDRS